MMNMPIIRMEVQGMKHQVQMMLSKHQLKLDQSVNDALEAYCTDANINAIVMEATRSALDKVIKEEINSFYQYGEGRKVISESVKDILRASMASNNE